MRLIKLAFLSAVILFGVVFLISLLIPSQVRISRAIDITVSKDSLLPVIADLRQWKQWNDLVNNIELTDKQYTDSSITAGKLQVTKRSLIADTLLTSWQQPGGRVLTSGFTWHEQGGQLVLQWYFDVHLRWYPWEKFGSIVFDKQLGPSMEKSLDKLKKLLEKRT